MRARLAGAVVVAALSVLPIVWMAATALKPPGEFVSGSAALWPRAPTLMHLEALAAAYALARLSFPRRLDMAFLVFILVVKLTPPIVLAVPLYQVLRGLGLLDTLGGLVLAYQIYALPFAVWMLLGVVRDVPVAYEDAARIDGAGTRRLLLDIVFPIMAPGIAATAILVAVAAWNEFLFAFLFMQSPSGFTLPTAIATRINEDETLWGQLSALGLLASLPILCLVGVVHRALTRGFAGGLA